MCPQYFRNRVRMFPATLVFQIHLLKNNAPKIKINNISNYYISIIYLFYPIGRGSSLGSGNPPWGLWNKPLYTFNVGILT